MADKPFEQRLREFKEVFDWLNDYIDKQSADNALLRVEVSSDSFAYKTIPTDANEGCWAEYRNILQTIPMQEAARLFYKWKQTKS